MVRAYVDESERDGPFGKRYVLAATIPFIEDCEPYRSGLRELLPDGQKKLRWYKAFPEHKARVIATLRTFEVMHCIVTHDMADENSEQARKKCMTMLAYEIADFDVDHAVFESRGPKLDGEDLKMLNYLRTSKTIPQAFRGSHVLGLAEPLLWMPDIACGALGESWNGEPRYLDAIKAQVHVVRTDGG